MAAPGSPFLPPAPEQEERIIHVARIARTRLEPEEAEMLAPLQPLYVL
jgi:hypothetical protein